MTGTGAERRRFVLACAVVLSSAALAACALIFDFGDYDTSEPAHDHDGAAVVAPSVEAGSFDLLAPDALTITPGTTGQLAIAIARHGDGNGRVVISVAETPAGIAPILATSIEPEASGTTLDVQVLATTAAAVVPIQISAVEGTVTRTKDVLLTLRGPSCSADLGFGKEGNGLFHWLNVTRTNQINQGVYLAEDGTHFTFGAVVKGQLQVFGFDENQAYLEVSVLDFTPQAIAAPDSDGGMYVALQTVVQHVFGHDLDPSFGDAGQIIARAPVAFMSATPTGLTLLESGNGFWVIEARGANGQRGFTELAPSDDSNPTLVPKALGQSGAGIYACGNETDAGLTRAAYSRWALDGVGDRTFGTHNLLTLEPGTAVEGCIADDAGVVALGSRNGEVVLYSLLADGTYDPSFGDGGTASALVDADLATTSIVADDHGVLVLTSGADDGTAMLSRYDRNTGQLDSTFGAAGRCSLAPLGLGGATVVTLTKDGKIFLLSGDYDQSIVGRLWP